MWGYLYLLPIRYSVLPALSIDGALCVAIIEGSVDHIDFQEFITEVLENMTPYPGRNSILIMDNASIHKNEELIDMVLEK